MNSRFGVTWEARCQKLKSMVGEFPENITTLNCNQNELTSLVGCPENVNLINCMDNKLTSLEGCSPNLRTLYCAGNPDLDLFHLPESVTYLLHGSKLDEYRGKSLEVVLETNAIRRRAMMTIKSAKNV